jgi:UDP-N-acetyl-D-glucosamine dehydrogenase
MSIKGKIAVVGQGYVGLPLSILAAEKGFEVYGIEINQEKLKKLESGISVCEDISDNQVFEQMKNNRYQVTSDFKCISLCDVVLICVPTPITIEKKPDLSALSQAAHNISKYLKKGSLVILESTVSPGTTRNFLLPILVSGSGLKSTDFDVAYSPERIDPLSKKWNLANTPKLVSAIDFKSTERASNFYKNFVDIIVVTESIEIAEIAKLLENSFRLINISFINEISKYCDQIGISTQAVIKAASTKPYGFMSFYPSLGVGGHCIPVDPYYLLKSARDVGLPSKIIELSAMINEQMPEYYATQAEKLLGETTGKRILILGVAYKPNLSDTRDTPVKPLISILKSKGAEVFWHDELVKVWNGEISSPLSSNYDLAILATAHDYFELEKLDGVPILKTQGLY